MQAQPAEQEEHYHPRPEYPLVLPRPPLNHAYRVARDAQRVAHRVQLLLRRLEDLPLLVQVPQHRLAARNVLVQRVVRALEELLLPQRVRLPRHILRHAVPAPGLRAARRPRVAQPVPRPRTCGCRGGCRARVGVLRRVGGEGSSPQQLGAVLGVRGLVARGFEGVHLCAEVGELGAEVAYPLVGLFLLGRVQLLLGEAVVLVDGAGEGGQRGGEGAEGGGGEEGRRGRVGEVGRGEVGELFADGGALFESRVELCVLGRLVC